MENNLPTVNDIVKCLDTFAYRVSRHELLSDIFACSAICISNRFDKIHFREREDIYLRIINKYDEADRMLIAEAFTMIFELLTSQINHGFGDYLGELYMKSDTQNTKTGQFFTPYSVSKASAEMTIDGALVKEYAEKYEGDIIEVFDDDGNMDCYSLGAGEVKFCRGEWCIHDGSNNSLYDICDVHIVEVIGNIHDNPELMEEVQA